MNTIKFMKIVKYLIIIFVIMTIISITSARCDYIKDIDKLKKLKKPILDKEMMKDYYYDAIYMDEDIDSFLYREYWNHKDNEKIIMGFYIMIYKDNSSALKTGEQIGGRWKHKDYFGKGFGDKHWIHISKMEPNHKKEYINIVFVKRNIIVDLTLCDFTGSQSSINNSYKFIEEIARYAEKFVDEF